MRRQHLIVGATLGLAALVMTGCSTATPSAHLAQLESHVTSETLIPVTTGTGNKTLGAATINSADKHVGIEASCTGKGTVTVTLPDGVNLTAACSESGGSQKATADYPTPAPGHGRVQVSTSNTRIHWNTTVYHSN